MNNFTAILNNVKVASTKHSVMTADDFENINGIKLLQNIRQITTGEKDGSHFIRTSLQVIDGVCLKRSDSNTESLANILIIDCDKHIDANGAEVEGAPDSKVIHDILRKENIAHVLYGSYSHYAGDKGNRYRIIIPTKIAYSKKQLAPTAESIVSLINSHLDVALLANAKENNTWSQPWYYPRRPINSTIPDLYFEDLEGNAIDIVDILKLPPTTKIKKTVSNPKEGEISPITAFNQQNLITALLTQYGYKFCCRSAEHEKWLRPNSTSGQAGITVKNNKIFSHHDDQLNDGYWHDAFDLMCACENLSFNDGVKHVAQITFVSDGHTVDEHNKSLINKCINDRKTAVILHSAILRELLQKIPKVDFKKIANIEEDKEPKQNHFHVIVIETILLTAKNEALGLCRNHDFIYLYNGAYWNLIDRDELKTFLGQAAEKMGINNLVARHYKFKDDLFKQFMTSAHLPKPEQPKNVVFINLKNGTFEITPTGTHLKSFNAADFITYQLPFEYNEEAIAPQFHKYIDKVLPDKTLQNILAEYLGYIFVKTSTLKLEKTLLLYGGGANGKSVCYEIVRSLLGEHNISEYSLQSLTNENGYERAMIANKLLNYASEISGKLQSYIFKQLVSGEAVGARLPYGNPFTMSDYAKLMFNCNELPTDVEHTEAYFRRFLIIPFNVTIPEHEQDKQLAKKIIDSELSGVFNWVLEGLKRLLEKKQFTESDIVRQMRTQYEKESDSVALFLEDARYEASMDNTCVPLKKLYTMYQNFCRDCGYKCLSYKNFQKRLTKSRILLGNRSCGLVAFVACETVICV